LLNFITYDLSNLINKEGIGFVRKSLFSLFPFYYRNKYFKILMEYKSKLPSLILDYYNKEKALTNKYSIDDILERLKYLSKIKSYEVIIKEIVEFILKNINIGSVLILDIHSAVNYLNEFISLQEIELDNIHNEKVNISRKLLLEKIKQNLNSPLTAFNVYPENTFMFKY